jgi:uncharacterized damage-inducible protein DinB
VPLIRKVLDLEVLYEYNRWANARILGAAAKISAAQFLAPGEFPHGGLRGTLVHTLFAEWTWRLRWQGAAPFVRWKPDDFPSLASLKTRWFEEEMKLMEFVDGLTEERLTTEFDYISTEGNPHRRVVWETMVHLVNHGTQHRSEAAAILTTMGQSPANKWIQVAVPPVALHPCLPPLFRCPKAAGHSRHRRNLSGAKDLVPALRFDPIAKQWIREVSQVTLDDGMYAIQRYRPRVEGLFAQIERWTHKDNGEVFWRSISKDNITSVYGKSVGARIADPSEIDPVREQNSKAAGRRAFCGAARRLALYGRLRLRRPRPAQPVAGRRSCRESHLGLPQRSLLDVSVRL